MTAKSGKELVLKGVLIATAIVLLGFGILSIYNSFADDSAEGSGIEGASENAVIAKQTGELKEFTIDASNWKFEPSTITVNLGDRVRITAKSTDRPHGFAIAEYGISEYLDGSTPKVIEFIADKAGTFGFYCNIPCGSGHGQMRGKLIVK